MYFKIVHTFIVWLFYYSCQNLYMITFYVNMIFSLCVRMLLCIEAWRLLLYCFIDDLVAVGRGETIVPMAYSADNGCRAVTAFPFHCTNAWWLFYMYISFLFHLCFYIVFTTACTCQKWQIKLFNQSIIPIVIDQTWPGLHLMSSSMKLSYLCFQLRLRHTACIRCYMHIYPERQ